jgi:hypothetical protein
LRILDNGSIACRAGISPRSTVAVCGEPAGGGGGGGGIGFGKKRGRHDEASVTRRAAGASHATLTGWEALAQLALTNAFADRLLRCE